MSRQIDMRERGTGQVRVINGSIRSQQMRRTMARGRRMKVSCAC